MSGLLEATFAEREREGREKYRLSIDARREAEAAQLSADLERMADKHKADTAAARQREIEEAKAKAERDTRAAQAAKYGDKSADAFDKLAAAVSAQMEATAERTPRIFPTEPR